MKTDFYVEIHNDENGTIILNATLNGESNTVRSRTFTLADDVDAINTWVKDTIADMFDLLNTTR